MKLFGALVFLCLAICAKSDDIEAQLKIIHNTCVQDSGVNEDLLPEVAKGNFVEDEKLMCYFKCQLVVTQFMTKEGKFNFSDELFKILPPDFIDSAKKMAYKCLPQIKTREPCRMAFDLMKCARGVDPVNFRVF